MTLMLTSILAIAISVPSIGLRWLARIKTSKLGWDDYMALVAATLLLVLAALQLESKHSSLSLGVIFPRSNLITYTGYRHLVGLWSTCLECESGQRDSSAEDILDQPGALRSCAACLNGLHPGPV